MKSGDYHLFTGGFSRFPVKIICVRMERKSFRHDPSSYYWKTVVDVELLNGTLFPLSR